MSEDDDEEMTTCEHYNNAVQDVITAAKSWAVSLPGSDATLLNAVRELEKLEKQR